MDNVPDRLRQIVSEQLGIGEHEITPDAAIVEDLGADSLDVAEIVMECEDVFRIEIDDDTADRFDTFGTLLNHVAAAVLAKRGAA